APADPEVREWRKAYLRRAFKLETGTETSTSRGYGAAQPPGSGGGEKPGDGADAATEWKYPPPEIYGLSSGVIGLRLFPHPTLDTAARKKWDARRYYNDPDYYSDPKLVRPFRVGMSCAFCHASFHPLDPPRDLTDPGWENISGNIGAQYLRI